MNSEFVERDPALEPLPPIRLFYQCGDQVLDVRGARCGLVVAPFDPTATRKMQISAGGTDREVLFMALAVVDYVRSLGLGSALHRCLESGSGLGEIRLVRATRYEAPTTNFYEDEP